jgi:hypothetical protein
MDFIPDDIDEEETAPSAESSVSPTFVKEPPKELSKPLVEPSLSKEELCALLSARLRNPKTATPDFIKMSGFLMKMLSFNRNFKVGRSQRYRDKRSSKVDKRSPQNPIPKTTPINVDELVRKIESERKKKE